jgi:hypothetical protein
MSYSLLVPHQHAQTPPGHPGSYTLMWDFPFTEGSGQPLNHGLIQAACNMTSGFVWDGTSCNGSYGGVYCDGTSGCALTVSSAHRVYDTPTSANIPSGYIHRFVFSFTIQSFQSQAYFMLFDNMSGNAGWYAAIDSDGSMAVGIKNTSSIKYGDGKFNVNGMFVVNVAYTMSLNFLRPAWDESRMQCLMKLYKSGILIKDLYQTWNSNDFPNASVVDAVIGNSVARDKTQRARFQLGRLQMARGRINTWGESTHLMEPGYW